MISLLLHESEVKQGMSINNKDIIQMYLGYNWLITQKTLPSEAKQGMSVNNKDIIRIYQGYNWLIIQKTLPISAFFVTSKQWLRVMFTYQSFVYY